MEFARSEGVGQRFDSTHQVACEVLRFADAKVAPEIDAHRRSLPIAFWPGKKLIHKCGLPPNPTWEFGSREMSNRSGLVKTRSSRLPDECITMTHFPSLTSWPRCYPRRRPRWWHPSTLDNIATTILSRVRLRRGRCRRRRSQNCLAPIRFVRCRAGGTGGHPGVAERGAGRCRTSSMPVPGVCRNCVKNSGLTADSSAPIKFPSPIGRPHPHVVLSLLRPCTMFPRRCAPTPPSRRGCLRRGRSEPMP